MPTIEEFQRRRRGRPEGGSKYRIFLRALEPGVVGVYPLDGANPESVRSAMWWGAIQEKVKIRTTLVDDELWVVVVDPEEAETDSPPEVKKPSKPRRRRREA